MISPAATKKGGIIAGTDTPILLQMAARLNDSNARNAKPRLKPYKLTDGNGLHLLITPNGKRSWRYRYRICGVENLYAIGHYPQITLQQARQLRDEARKLIKQGLHPAQVRKSSRLVEADSARTTFRAVAGEWMQRNEAKWSPYYGKQVKTVMGGDVFPAIGDAPIATVKSAHLLAIIKRVEDRGASSVAILIRQWCSAVFRYAASTLRAEGDPAAALRGAVTRPRVQHKTPLAQNSIAALVK